MRDREQLEMIDMWDDAVDTFTPEEEDMFIEVNNERAKRMISTPTVPCACNWCDNWIDNTELYYIIGVNDDRTICLECAIPLYDLWDKGDDERKGYKI